MKNLFTSILFYFFMCDGLSFINTKQKNFKTFQKKGFNFQYGWEKTSCLQISAEEYWWKHEMQVAWKTVYWKNNRVFQAPDAFFKQL